MTDTCLHTNHKLRFRRLSLDQLVGGLLPNADGNHESSHEEATKGVVLAEFLTGGMYVFEEDMEEEEDLKNWSILVNKANNQEKDETERGDSSEIPIPLVASQALIGSTAVFAGGNAP
jgi:hypothetical protein